MKVSMGTVLTEEEYQEKIYYLNKILANPKADSLHQINQKIIMGILSVLEEKGISCFLEFNSLLGKVRDNNYIPWSKSVIVSAINENSPHENLEVEQYLNDHYTNEKFYENMSCSSIIVAHNGYKKTTESLIDHENKIHHSTAIGLLHRRSPLPFRKFEIWPMVKSKGNGNWYHERFHNNLHDITDNEIFPLKECELHGIKTFMPNESEKHLQRLYGDNWQTPMTKKHSKYHYEYVSARKQKKL